MRESIGGIKVLRQIVADAVLIFGNITGNLEKNI